MRKQLQPLTESEKRAAEMNHNLVYSFLHKYGYSIEEHYNIAIFGYLAGIQAYHRKKELQEKYTLASVCWNYMRAEIGNYHRTQAAQKRKPAETVVSLDAETIKVKNICSDGKSVDSELLEQESIKELLEKLPEIQRKIASLKLNGYKNNEIIVLLKIPTSTYYKKLQRIKQVILQMEND